MSAQVEIRTALKDVLTTEGLRVYAHAPQQADGASTATWPYVEIGWVNLGEWDTQTGTGFEFLARIHSRGRAGMTEVLNIQGDIYDALHRQEMTITGQNNIVLMLENSFCDRAPDGSFHGICEYRGLTEAA
jgi:hypothetical protein